MNYIDNKNLNGSDSIMKFIYIDNEQYIVCHHEDCEKNQRDNNIICVDGYGFYCEEHSEENFVSCPHCNELTSNKRNWCECCNNNIELCLRPYK